MTSVERVHDGKVLVNASAVDRKLMNAISHSEDDEDPN